MDTSLIFNEIDKLIAERKIAKMSFYAAIGYTQPGYEKMKTNKSLKVETLFKISETLGVEPSHFFGIKATETFNSLQIKYWDLLEKYNSCLENTNILNKKSQLIEKHLHVEPTPLQTKKNTPMPGKTKESEL